MLSAGTDASCCLQFVQVAGPADFGLLVRQDEDEITEPDLFRKDAPQISQQGGRALLQKAELLVVGALHEFGAAGLQHDGHVGNEGAYGARQRKPGRRRQNALTRELHV